MRYFLGLLFMPALLAPSVALGQEFLVLGELFYQNQPAESYFEGYGIKTDKIVYQAALGCPPEQGLTEAAANNALGTSYQGIVQLDQECWQTWSVELRTWVDSLDARQVGGSIAREKTLKMCEGLRWFKNKQPTLKVGYYSDPPLFDTTAYLNATHFAAWKAADDILQPLADSMNYLCPSVYMYRPDTTSYIGYATALITEAKRMAKGKPIYAFVSPHYIGGDSAGHDVSYNYFASILRAIKNAGADGVVIFAGTYPTFGNHAWDSSAGWWTATKEFLASQNMGNLSIPAPPSLVSPSNGATNIPSSYLLRWRKSPGARSYHLQLADNITFQDPILDDSTITDTLRTLGSLLNNTRYYCRVSAKGTTSWSTFCISVNFVTSIDFAMNVSTLGTEVPKAFVLRQNFPNPFNPSTIIRYSLPLRSEVSLTVYDTMGQFIRQLVNGERDAGDHDIRFDGSGLASGTYFYCLRVGNFVSTKQLLLLK
jgi:hypothetical protein